MNRTMVVYLVLLVAAGVAPFIGYPIFLMTCLCFALFACAFNLLVGFTGLLSFGHAMFFAAPIGGDEHFANNAIAISDVD